MTIQDHTGTNKYYADLFEEHGTDARGAGWKNKQAQWNRFDELTKIITSTDSFSINDLGCGFGSLYDYLADRSTLSFTYTGYDILDNMLDKAKETHSDQSNANFIKIETAAELLPADYTIASGIFNLKYNHDDEQWLQYILRTIEQMFEKSSKGVAFNILTKYSDKDYMQSHLYYADPLFIFDYCKQKLTRKVALLHDYEEYDFTILIRK